MMSSVGSPPPSMNILADPPGKLNDREVMLDVLPPVTSTCALVSIWIVICAGVFPPASSAAAKSEEGSILMDLSPSWGC